MLFVPTLIPGRSLGTVRRRASGYRAHASAADLIRVRPGVFVDEEEWRRARPEARVVARARALTMTSSDAPVVSHESAAAIHGLPLLNPHPMPLLPLRMSPRPQSRQYLNKLPQSMRLCSCCLLSSKRRTQPCLRLVSS